MVGYLDSSAVLDYIFQDSNDLEQVWELGRVFSSELFAIECRRTILRERIRGALDDEKVLDAFDKLSSVLARLHQIVLTNPIKQRAGESFPFHVKTLDALHLATALAVKAELAEEVVVFSHDTGMNRCAKVLGFAAPWL